MKRSIIVVSILLALVFLSAITIAIVVALEPIGKERKAKTGSGEIVQLINLNGAIADGADSTFLGEGIISPNSVRHRIEDAENDPDVKAIIFKVNSPGGTVGASQEIAELVRNSDKPIVIFAGDMVASGAYYFSSQADRIVAKPGSLVGSIGVISEIPDLNGLYEKLGIKMQVIKSGKNKDMFQRTLTDEERDKFQALSDETYRQFVEDVAVGREMKKEDVLELATGEVFPATIAKKHGLVDEIGGYQTAVDAAAKLAHIKDPEVREYEPTFFEEFFGTSVDSMVSLLKFRSLAFDLKYLDKLRGTSGVPQYKYSGGQ